MVTTLKFLPGSTIRWRATRFIVVDYADIDAIIARELGKRKLERIPVRDAKPDRTPGDQKAWTPENELARSADSSRPEEAALGRR
jgi:hypothetical protein